MNNSPQPNNRHNHAPLWICMAALIPPIFAADSCSFGGSKPSGSGAAQSSGPATVTIVDVEPRDLEYSIQLPGTVEGIETAQIYSKVGGFLKAINVEIGDRVVAGQELAILDVPELATQLQAMDAAVKSAEAKVRQADAAIAQVAADLDSSQAMLDEARTLRGEKIAAVKLHKAELARLETLVEKGVREPKKLAEVQYEVEIAEAGLQTTAARERTAEANLAATGTMVQKTASDKEARQADVLVAEAEREQVVTLQAYTRIVAPFPGLVVRRNVDAGTFVQSAEGNSAAKPLIVLARTNVVRLRVDLPMAEVHWLDKEDTAKFSEIAALPGDTFEGNVTRFASALDSTSRMMHVEIELPNPDHQLLPGFYGYVNLSLQRFPDIPSVPATAIVSDEDGSYVFVVEDDICIRQKVTIAYDGEDFVGIESGLSVGEIVVKSGVGQLADGDQVKPVREATEKK